MKFQAERLINNESISIRSAMETSTQSVSGLKHADYSTALTIWNKVNTKAEMSFIPYYYDPNDETLLFRVKYAGTALYFSTCVRVFELTSMEDLKARVKANDNKGFNLDFSVEHLKMLIQPILNSSEEMRDVVDEVLYFINMIKRYTSIKDCRIAIIS